MFQLRPLALEREGLVPALREFANDLRERTGLEVKLEVPFAALTLSSAVETNVYYVIQEAAQNTLKHAGARHLRIALTLLGDELQVFISDDGKGFDLKQVEDGYGDRKSLGLLNLSERARLIHARLTIYSNIGQGTTVHLSVPLNGTSHFR
jgi:two-component system sensor histidine kinase DegS